MVAAASGVRPRARGRLEREYRQRIFWRSPVPHLDVAVGRRPLVSASRVAEGAVVPGVARVPARWELVARVGDRPDVRAEVKA